MPGRGRYTVYPILSDPEPGKFEPAHMTELRCLNPGPMFTRAELQTIDDAALLIRLALESSAPSTSRMGNSILTDPDALVALDRVDRESPAFAIRGLEMLAAMRRRWAEQNRDCAESAPITRAWGDSTNEMVAKFREQERRYTAEADRYADLAVRLRRAVSP